MWTSQKDVEEKLRNRVVRGVIPQALLLDSGQEENVKPSQTRVETQGRAVGEDGGGEGGVPQGVHPPTQGDHAQAVGGDRRDFHISVSLLHLHRVWEQGGIGRQF